MKASQYIYTSWKNAPNFGFSLYSKSADVTSEEEAVISLMMKYRAPNGLPYEPTEQEIETLFPRVFAYFRLPTGRYCIAQSVYIGHEYKGFENQGRMGNYLIHAFIFGEDPAFKPATFIRSDLFRRDLTLEEWRATNPPPLPQVELPTSQAISEAEIRTFLSAPGRKESLKLLVQAVIDNMDAGKPIYLNDEPANLPLWYRAATLALPGSLVKKLTFILASPEDKNVNVRITPDVRPLISSVAGDGLAVIDYRQKQLSGALVFDFKSNTLTTVTPGAYVSAVVDLLAVDARQALEFADRISLVVKETGLTPDRATAVCRLLKGDYAFTLDELVTAYEDALKYHGFDANGFADAMALRIVRNDYPQGDGLKNFCTSLYRLMNAQNKRAVVDYYFNTYAQTAAAPEAYVDGFKRVIPYPFKDFVTAHFAQDSGNAYFEANRSSFNKVYLLFAGVYDFRPELPGADVFLKNVIAAYAGQRDREKVDKLFACARAHNANPFDLAKCCMDALTSKGYANLDRNWFLSLVRMLCGNASTAAYYMKNYLLAGRNEEMVKVYYNFCGEAAEFSAADKLLRGDPGLAEFFSEMERYIFANSTVTRDGLLKYYREYYLQHRDPENNFARQLDRYFAGVVGNKTRDAVSLFTEIWLIDNKVDRWIVEKFYGYTVAKAGPKEIESSLKDASLTREYQNLFHSAQQWNIPIDAYFVAQQGMSMPTERYQVKKKPFGNNAEAEANNAKYEEVAQLAGKGRSTYPCLQTMLQYESFVNNYTDRVLLLADGLLCMSLKPEDAFNLAIYQLLRIKGFQKAFIEAMDKTKVDVENLMKSLIIYAAYKNAPAKRDPRGGIMPPDPLKDDIKQFTFACLDSFRGGKKKQLLEDVQGQDPSKPVADFVTEFNATQKAGLFERLFGRKNKEPKQKDAAAAPDPKKTGPVQPQGNPQAPDPKQVPGKHNKR